MAMQNMLTSLNYYNINMEWFLHNIHKFYILGEIKQFD